jgi:putative DNA primase/helicase
MTQEPQREYRWGEIPKPLRKRDQWMVTVNNRPKRPRRGWQHAEQLLSFTEARQVIRQSGGKIAYVLKPDDPFVIFDLDDVVPRGKLDPSDEAIRVVERLDSYTETSQSGQGLHVVCRGSRLPDRKESGPFDTTGKMEVFDADQYVVLTGDRVGSYTSIDDGQAGDDVTSDPVYQLQREYLEKRNQPASRDSLNASAGTKTRSSSSSDLSPKEIKRTISEYATAGSEEAQRAQRKWKSPSSSDCGLKSPSEADLSFAADLAFWCCENESLVDKCFRSSNRYRSKWDEIHYADGRTYGEEIINIAITSNYDTFSGHHVR